MSSKKEEFLKLKTFEEFDKRRNEFDNMEWDAELSDHFHTLLLQDANDYDKDGLIIEAFTPKREEN